MNLNGKVCMITGGGSGIGRCTALSMAREGASVVLLGRTKIKVDGVKKEVEANGGVAMSFDVDVTDLDSVLGVVELVKSDLGGPHVLVNNAGHSSYHRRVLTTSAEEIHAVMGSNLVGTIFCSQAVLPVMVKDGEGTIINVSSLAGVHGSLMGGMAYSAAKAAVINFTRFINNEYPDLGIRASVVIPGEVNTPILANRPVPPDEATRSAMVGAEDAAEIITMIARLPQRTSIPELILEPTVKRDFSDEISRFP